MCDVILNQDGLLRVLLDGGPSRIFYPADAKLLEEDLEVLKVGIQANLVEIRL